MALNKSKKRSATGRNALLVFIIVLLVIIVLIPQLRKEMPELPVTRQFEQIDGALFVPEDSPVRGRIGTQTANIEEVRRYVSAPATVEANPSKRANIFPPVSGRIVNLFVNMGQSVRKGDALFEIYSPDLAEVQTQFINSRSALAQAERDYRRKEELHQRGIAPLRELEEAKTEYDIARSEIEGVSLILDIMGIAADDIGKPLIVRSPIDGRVVDLAVAPGEFIVDPEEPLLIVADLSSVWVTANIQEKDIRFVNTGADVTARFPAYPGDEYDGTVLFISDILDEDTRTARVRVEFDNEDMRLKPGMFANVRFHSDPAPAITLPSRAVLQRRDYNYVYVEIAPYTFEIRQVVTGETIDNRVVILEGLEVGESIVVNNAVLFQ